MKFSNDWVTYFDRSYEKVKASLLTRLKIKVPEITDFSPNHILIVIIEMFSGIAELLNAYLDNLSRESFLPTARRFSSVLKHARAYDYHINSRIPATVDLILYLEANDGSPIIAAVDHLIPSGTIIEAGGIQFQTVSDATIENGTSETTISAYQVEAAINQNVGRTNGLPSQIVDMPKDVAEGSIQLIIDGQIYVFKETLSSSNFMDAHFTTTLSVNKVPTIIFGNGVQGKIPPKDKDIIATYKTTIGDAGNNVKALTITDFVTQITLPGLASDNLKCKNPMAPTGGSEVESMESIRKNSVLSLRTLWYAVTESDHEDIAKLAPGVADAVLRYYHPRYLEIFISPINGGEASTELLESTYNFIFSRRLLGRNITVKSAGQTELLLSFDLATKFRHDKGINTNEVALALLAEYSATKSRINKAIRYSDIIAIIENSPSTEYVTITKLSTKPVPKPLGDNTHVLNVSLIEVLPGSSQRAYWKVVYAGNQYLLYKDGKAQPSISFYSNYLSVDGAIQLELSDGSYTVGDSWEFTTYPYNNDMEISDYTLPVLSVNNLTITNV